MNFNLKSDSRLVLIPVDLLSDYKKDAPLAHRDFGAKVTRKVNKFIKDIGVIKKLFDNELKRPWDGTKRFYDWFIGNTNYNYHAHVDLGLNHCAAGLCLGHQEDYQTIINFTSKLCRD